MCFKRLVFAFVSALAQALVSVSPLPAAEPVIIGPDGPRGIEPRKAPRSPPSNLRRWLDQRRQERDQEKDSGKERNQGRGEATESQPEQSGGARAAKKAAEPPPPPSTASMRWELDLSLPKIVRLGSRDSSWTSEPSPALRMWGRLSAPPPGGSRSFWLGLRLLSLTGSGRSEGKSARYASTYFGPALAWEWLSVEEFSPQSSGDGDESKLAQSWRHRLAFGWALVNRQGEPGLGDLPRELATRSIGLDGPGLWLEYSYGNAWNVQSEWQLTGGLQLLSDKLLVYAGLGISLWSASPAE